MQLIEMEKVNPYNEFFLGDPSDIDAFHKYWMDVSDPRGTYLLFLEEVALDNGGDY